LYLVSLYIPCHESDLYFAQELFLNTHCIRTLIHNYWSSGSYIIQPVHDLFMTINRTDVKFDRHFHYCHRLCVYHCHGAYLFHRCTRCALWSSAPDTGQMMWLIRTQWLLLRWMCLFPAIVWTHHGSNGRSRHYVPFVMWSNALMCRCSH